MKIALAHNHFNNTHLEKIKSEMTKLGTPKIKAVWMECYGVYATLEGCHRIRAAKELDLVPEIIEIDYEDIYNLDLTEFDLDITASDELINFIDNCYKREIIIFEEK